MSEFLSPHFFGALFTAIVYGLKVVVGMALVGGVLTVASGGPAAREWKKSEQPSH